MAEAPASGHGAEAELVAALKRGDAAAFETLVHEYGDYLYRVAMRITRNETESGDAVQDAFLQAFRSIDGFEGRALLKTWLHRLVVNAALMRGRSRKRRKEISIDEVVTPLTGHRQEPDWDFQESVENELGRQGTRDAVSKSIDELPENYRIVLVLRDIEGYSTREVAELLDDSEGSVKVRLHRARAGLKKLLEPLYVEDAL